MDLHFEPLAARVVAALRKGGPDAYGMTPESVRSDGGGNPCRYCLGFVPEGAGMLILAHRPFRTLQPYAETGPIFLCADCARHDGRTVPPVLTASAEYLLKGYGPDERIVYGSGKVVAQVDVPDYARGLLRDGRIRFVDVRSARNNCFLLRIRPSEGGSA